MMTNPNKVRCPECLQNTIHLPEDTRYGQILTCENCGFEFILCPHCESKGEKTYENETVTCIECEGTGLLTITLLSQNNNLTDSEIDPD